MKRSSLAIAAVAALLTVPASAAERATVAEERFDLHAIFERAPGVLMVDERGTTTAPGSVEVVIARIGPGGKLIKACVDSEEAAQRFFNAPIESLHGKQATER
ncbi:MAG: hypothetical protein ABI779_16215 [Acidobacteriota bacterium]